MGTNLIYNGNFANGTDSWSGSGITASNGVVTVTGGLSQNIYVPVANGRKYRLTYDLKVNTNDGSHNFYIALCPYDSTKTFININTVYRPTSASETTLGAALANGDTTVTLASGTNWPTSRTNQRIGICNKLAWGYKRNTYSQPYQSISGNVITLKAAWAGGSWAAGTKVTEFEDGSGYFYPHYITNANLPTDWTTYSVEFNGGDSMRYSCVYFTFYTLGYSHNYSMRNIKIECISDYQTLDAGTYTNAGLYRPAILKANHFNELGAKIRYIKDCTSGSTANTGNHWCEFEVFNSVGENIALGKNLTYGSGTTTSGTHVNSVATDGLINSSYVSAAGGTDGWVMMDLGFVEDVYKIKIWHYYPDGRTYYKNRTMVSVDGTNWWPVYQGEKPETSAGNEIIVTNNQAQLYRVGELKGYQFYEV